LELTITLPEETDRVAVLGPAERNIKLLREAFGISIVSRDGSIRLSGEGRSVNRAAEVIADLTESARRRRPMGRLDLIERIHRLTADEGEHGPILEGLDVYARGQKVVAKTAGQRAYIEAINNHDMIFCIGPAGTGKTYLAVAAAVSMLKRGQTRKLVLVRPAVEAGERIGFLPGDIAQKVNPYLRPLFDSLHDMMPFEQVQRFMASDLIEIVPLAFMRGRTLNDASIILDEAQNTTKAQMLMFLTRLGHGSKMIITGDTSQIDLEDGTESGLIDAARRLRHVPGIAFVGLDKQDIVRHSLVQKVVNAYGQEDPPV
jgi:phosphate starvation-inducible PhoH-like protein